MNTTVSRKRRFVAALLLAGLFCAPSSWALPKIKVLATGGTIAGYQASTSNASYRAGTFSVHDLIQTVPELTNIAELSGEQIANIGSQAMTHEIWVKLAKRVDEVLAGDTDGVVITHGADTMEETAYFLSLVVKSEKPIVLVGSMRPATAIGADGPANLYNAVALAADPASRGRGPLVVLNDTVHYAREAERMNTTRLDSIHSPNRGPAGVMNTGKVFFYNQNNWKSGFSLDHMDATNFPYVEIVYSYANFDGRSIDDAVKRGAKGIILAGVGDGNTTDAALDALSRAAKAGVIVVRSTRVGSGAVDRNVEVNDDELGFIAAMELNPQKARILLMLGLTQTNDPKKLQQLFMQY